MQLASAVSESGNDERIKVNWDLVIYPAAVQLAQLTDLNYYHHIMQSDFLAKWLCTESGTVAFTNKARLLPALPGSTPGYCARLTLLAAAAAACLLRTPATLSCGRTCCTSRSELQAADPH